MFSDAVVKEGRLLLEAKNLPGFYSWCKAHLPRLNQAKIREIFDDPRLWEKQTGSIDNRPLRYYYDLLRRYKRLVEAKNLWDHLRGN